MSKSAEAILCDYAQHDALNPALWQCRMDGKRGTRRQLITSCTEQKRRECSQQYSERELNRREETKTTTTFQLDTEGSPSPVQGGPEVTWDDLDNTPQ